MSLPVSDIFDSLQQALSGHNRVILQAPPGAGKSTLLPLLLLESGAYSPDSQIVILEPRRVAARQIALFLAKQLGEPLGQRIGLKMRGESKTSTDTVITIVTDGVMVRQLQSDPELRGVGLVIFDEFHERALQTDLALALALDSQALNEELRLLIMSATLDTPQLSQALDAPVVSSEGRQFPVEVRYVNADIFPSLAQIVAAIKLALSEQTSSILVFLSGVGEIKRVQQALEDYLAPDTQCFPLYGGLSLEEQSYAIQPAKSGQRKVVLATNVAQTSLTIEGVDVVVDVGIEKVVQYQARTANEELIAQPISIASSIQRMGRAGRLRPGVCYRLGSKPQFERRRAHDVADIERVSLSQLLLEVSLWGAEFEGLFWASKPAASLLQAGKSQLYTLGFMRPNETTGKPTLTELGRHYRDFASDLRTSRLLYLAQSLNSDDDNKESNWLASACPLAVYLESMSLGQGDLTLSLTHGHCSAFQTLKAQIARLYRRLTKSDWQPASFDADHVGVLLALAYPDRIAKKQGKRWKVSNGAAVEFHSSQVESRADLILVVDYASNQYGQYIQSYAPISWSEIQAHLSALIETREQVMWSVQKQQPQKSSQTRIGELVLKEQTLPLDLSEQEWQALWRDYIAQQGLAVLGWDQAACTSLRNKLALVRQHLSHLSWPEWQEAVLTATLDDWLCPYLGRVRNQQELRKLSLADILQNTLDWEQQQALSQACPEYYRTPAGNRARIDYSSSQPKLSVKLQEMFGEPTTPSVCQGKQVLLIELLSPAKRPLQITQDLAHFWQHAYVEVKKEMKGRYPKHPWPDDPLTAIATNKTKSQMNR